MTEPNLSFEDVLDAVMFEEPEPSYAELLRWSGRYPQYRDDLADYFATWAVQKAPAETLPPVEIDEDRLVQMVGGSLLVNHQDAKARRTC